MVDFGTATTFDAVSTAGEYLGGAIAPGIEISVEALGRRGAQLHRVELARPRSVIGRTTVEALQSGILYGFAGQVDGVVTRMAAAIVGPDGDPDDVTVIATGGLAPLVLDEASVVDAPRAVAHLDRPAPRLRPQRPDACRRAVGSLGRVSEPTEPSEPRCATTCRSRCGYVGRSSTGCATAAWSPIRSRSPARRRWPSSARPTPTSSSTPRPATRSGSPAGWCSRATAASCASPRCATAPASCR